MTYPLYPYDSDTLTVIFVYGVDFNRQKNILLVPESIQLLAGLIALSMSASALILSIIRRKLNIRRSGLISTLIDTLISFVAGGNLRVKHGMERWFFAILLIGTFFITTIFAGGLLDYFYRILDQKIDTLEQLAVVNSPIYVSSSAKMHVNQIGEMLRFDQHHRRNSFFVL